MFSVPSQETEIEHEESNHAMPMTTAAPALPIPHRTDNRVADIHGITITSQQLKVKSSGQKQQAMSKP